MTDELSAAIERLRTSTQRLNAATDAAAQLLKDVEAFLEEANVGVPASVSLGYGAYDAEAESPDWEDFLSYRRLNSKFRIALIRRDISSKPFTETVRAWSECTRDEKIDILAALPDLLIEISKRVNEKIDRAELVLTSIAPQLSTKKRKGGA
ncbi:hypothetical protein VT84_13135 [Gemmata sp. SH-PL17]|uniref:hypothetical protein n=1 Tax=Gemmata sp. SH-PL17 TaxID=1630693 RepID=UPI00078B2A01|nr:hypothetical protein [Gemmata sp. SH-PL17]AMV25338.1 hypothetical protein VT84_13135 [Gemmata sp. SH-PL17]